MVKKQIQYKSKTGWKNSWYTHREFENMIQRLNIIKTSYNMFKSRTGLKYRIVTQ